MNLIEVSGRVQILVGHELSIIVRLLRMIRQPQTMIPPAEFIHDDYSANNLMWKFILRWFIPNDTLPLEKLKHDFHALWGQARSGVYDKNSWMEFQALIDEYERRTKP